ncbi:hypothetical protein B0O79_1670 [Flavobacteriaceae bacterium MAR_2009_75]|nr:hypothetical protein B0O79_1670 [Flavobacteriaceae bacterium MAR_2009_75]
MLKKEELFSKEGRLVKSFNDANKAQCEWYYSDSENLKYRFQLSEGYLDGAVIKYDSNGKEMARAVLNQGKLVSGTINLQKGYNNKNIKYYSLTKEQDYLHMNLYGEEDELFYEAKEKLYLGGQSYFNQDLGFDIAYLTESHLY